MEEPYTQVPHRVIETLARAHLSESAREVLDVIIRYTWGFNRKCHHLALSFFAKATDRHINVVWRALRELEHRKIIKKYSAATFRLPASWGICPIEDWLAPPDRVRLTASSDTQSDHDASNVLAKSIRGLTSGSDRGPTAQGDSDSPQEVMGDPPREVTKKEKNRNTYRKEKEKNTPLKIGPQGPFLESAKDALPRRLTFSKSLNTQKSQKQKPNAEPIIRLFEDEMGFEASLSKSERRQFAEFMTGCNQDRFQSEFVKLIARAKGKPIPEQLKRPGDICMLFARAAAEQAKNSGQRYDRKRAQTRMGL